MTARAALLLPLGSLLFGAACAPPSSGQGDQARYLEVVSDAGMSAAPALARCAEIEDAALRGDCAVVVAGRRAADEAPPPEEICAVAPEGVWRDECHFAAAEGLRRAGRRAEAAARCRAAGTFANDCGQHLWQSEVRAIAAPARGPRPPPFAEALPRAQSVYDRWAPHLEAGTDMAERFWRRFYQNGFEKRGLLDLGECAALPEDHRERCRGAALQLMRTRLDLDLRHLGLDPCGLPDGLAPHARALRLVPDPAFDLSLRDWQAQRCAPASPPTETP
ncbi:hypothetical protein L6R53_23700 [Myxococcota bacterium]|nr:hypothetical protein [Myxococcota bacterium]